MGRRVLVILPLALVVALGAAPAPPAAAVVVSWEDAFHLPPDRPPPPTPSEPDVAGSGPPRSNRFDPAPTPDPPPGPDDVPAAAPTRYQLADAWGRTWTSPDPAWLRTYVDRVNAGGGYPAAAAAPQYPMQAGEACGPAGCPSTAGANYGGFRLFGRR